MKRRDKHTKFFISVIAYALLAMTGTACGWVQESFDMPDESEDLMVSYLNFEMTLPYFPTESRTPAGDYDPGSTEWENYIDYNNDIHIYLFREDNTFLASLGVEDILITPNEVVDASNYKKYTAIGIVHAEVPQNFKVMVLANCGRNYPSAPTNIDNLVNSLTYVINSPLTTLKRDTLIPMFGIQEFNNFTVPAGQLTDIGTIFMLRAVAKIEVCVDASEVHELEYVELSNYNKKGLCAPKRVYARTDYVKNNYDQDYVTHVSIPNVYNESNQENPWRLGVHHQIFYGSTARNVYTIYLPEYRNLVPDASGNPTTVWASDYAVLHLKFTDTADPRVFTLEFKRYNVEGQPRFDIQRNNYYKYTVNRAETYLNIEVDVIPYNHVDLDPDFGINRDEDGNPIDSEGNII